MGNTVFYDDIKKISWKDILSESFKKHDMQDLEYALAAGSPYDTASPETMLKKWHKPWVWTRIFLLLSVVGFGFYGLLLLFGMNPNVGWPMLIVLTCITPITTMVLFWELNMARDVSFVKLLLYFFIGGLMALTFTLLLDKTGISDAAIDLTNTNSDIWEAWVAPLTEEPAKLLAGLVILMLLAKSGDNVFGCTGIAVAAGVGTGFTLFESFGYVMTYSIIGGFNNLVFTLSENVWRSLFQVGLEVVKVRSLPALNSHMLMCVPYISMVALVYHEKRNWRESVFNKKTGLAFLASCLLHGWWDCMDGIAMKVLGIDVISDAAATKISHAETVQELMITALFFILNLYVIRLCLQQAVREGDYVSGQGMALGERTQPHIKESKDRQEEVLLKEQSVASMLTVVSTGSTLKGAAWQCTNTVLIGKLNDCAIRFPGETAGLSRVHCRLKNCGSHWTVCDVGSSYGTYLNGAALIPNTEYELPHNSVLELGSSAVQLKIQ